jgi:hypothetical protein
MEGPMKRTTALTCLLLLLPQAGCKPLLYPVARAFGGPSEGELKNCRLAFDGLKASISKARIVVFPALNPTGRRSAPFSGTGEVLAAALREQGAVGARMAEGPADLTATRLGSNQMRYTWERARAWGEWVRTSHLEGDYFLFVEILEGPPGKVAGIQAYVVDASGQAAYVHLMNSHHFKGQPPQDAGAACELAEKGLFRHLQMMADAFFPPYGVG